ncbi:MAG: EAL domain-containing protein [Hyphomicrobiaceae bacterium]|nr:EAL domain-containing protein [Hyphomicrobiaceae bacterium]
MNKHDVVHAIDQDRLSLVLQPVVSTQTHRPVFYEALLRMRTDTGEVKAAADFVAAAEEQNYIHEIDRRALQLAIQLLEQHRAFDLSVNISGLTTADFTWIRMLDELTPDRRMAHRLIVEITETAAIVDINRTLAFVDALRDFGCRIAIDDYGAGHTNFTNLSLIAPNIVKIDQSYVARHAEADARAFIEGVIDLSQTLGFETVAEGVETEASAVGLTEMGATYLQGYLFGAPDVPEVALRGMVDHDRS